MNCRVGTTDNGWTSESLCLDWFKTNFVPAATAHGDPTKPILLIYDGHSSHTSLELIDYAIAHNIILYELPSHTTHKLQPCDVGAFAPLKREWVKHAQQVLERDGIPMCLRDVVEVYMEARTKAFKADTIRSAFKRSGIVSDPESGRPRCNIDVFSAADFAPSIPSSTSLHLPEGFPADYGDVPSKSTTTSTPPAIPSAIGPTAVDGCQSLSEEGSDDEADLNEWQEDDWVDEDHVGTDVDEHQGTRILVEDFGDLEHAPLGQPELELAEEPTTGENNGSDSESHNEVLQPSRSDQLPASHARAHTPPPRPNPSNISSLPPGTTGIPLVAHFDDEPSDDEADRLLSPNSREKKIRALLRKARSQRDEMVAQNILAGRFIGDLQVRLNAKRKTRRNERNVAIGGRVVTTEEGRAKAAEQKKAREDKLRKEKENLVKKQNARYEMDKRRIEVGKAGMVFSGALTSQKRPVLLDIAWCLDLEEKGTREELINRIRTHVDGEPSLRQDPRFAGLWPSTRRSGMAATTKRTLAHHPPIASSSNSTPTDSSQHHINDVSRIPLQLAVSNSNNMLNTMSS